eukprot:5716403-Prymnesium_polylepis.1
MVPHVPARRRASPSPPTRRCTCSSSATPARARPPSRASSPRCSRCDVAILEPPCHIRAHRRPDVQ